MAIYGTLGGQDSATTGYPSIQPTLDLNFAKTKALDPRITFYRNSLATYTDDKGIIRTVPENVPRFDHNLATGESLGLLIEESRTNLMPYSDNTVLTSSASVTTSRSTGLDGNPTSALNVTYNSNSGSFVLTANAAVSATNTYTFSVYIKKNVNSTSGNAGAVMYSYFNSGTAGQWSGTILNEDGQHLGQAPIGVWKRYSKTITVTSGTGVQITLPGYDTSGLNADYFGAQIELGAFATSYIPTSGSAVTRSADFVEMSGTNFSSWYNPIESTFYTNYIMNSLDGAYNNPSFYAYDNASAQNYLAIFGYNPAYAWAQASNATAAGISLGGTTTTNVDYKVSFGVKVNDFAASINGSAVSTDASGNVPVVNQMFIGKRVEVSNAHLNGTLKRLTYYPKRLTNAQLQNLTA